MPHDCSVPQVEQGVYAFDARGAARRFHNDQDPLPQQQQLSRHFGARMKAGYAARKPGAVIIDLMFIS